MSTILIVDDERSILAAFKSLLASRGYNVITAERAEEAAQLVESEQPGAVIMDIHTPGMSGLDALEQIKQRNPRVPVIIITGYGTMDTAIEATKRGAFDYQLKPLEPETILDLIERAITAGRSMTREVALGDSEPPPRADVMLGNSAPMQDVYKMIGRVAPTDATVLIRGESGTGKELAARAIYQHSRRAAAPMIVVNCAALPESLLESEFFGHERGAFTGAVARRIGKFQQACGGTIFLDEIGELPPHTQAKLLRVLQQREFEPLGSSSETIKADVRIIAATNRDLEGAMADGRFREDLFHRLSVVTLFLPPLRERGQDVSELIEFFLKRFSAELGTPPLAIVPPARELLVCHRWAGNVRELENCLQRLVIVCQGRAIGEQDVRQAIQGSHPTSQGDDGLQSLIRALVARHLEVTPTPQTPPLLEQVELELLREALRRARGNQTLAAKLVGVPRSTLYARLQKFGIGESIADSNR